MKLRQLQERLQIVESFREPKIEYEQYPTSPEIAAHMLFTIHNTFDDIEDKVVGDLGCGCGILGIGATLLGSRYTLGVDIDPAALEIASTNVKKFSDDDADEDGELDIDFLCFDVRLLGSDGEAELRCRQFDTIIMNPPFGTKTNPHVDVAFLEKALQLSRSSVYSLHKSSTREHIAKKAAAWQVHAEVVAQLRFDIPNMYRFHKEASVDVDVDFWRFSKESLSTNLATIPAASQTHHGRGRGRGGGAKKSSASKRRPR